MIFNDSRYSNEESPKDTNLTKIVYNDDISYKIYNSSHFCENSSEIIEITSINYSRKSK